MDAPGLELLLFSVEPRIVTASAAAGVSASVVDLEFRGKERRQEGADTQINTDTPLGISACRTAGARSVVCRINAVGPHTPNEIEDVISHGPDEILVPMVKHPTELERVLSIVRGRVRVGTLIETTEAVERVRDIARLPLSRIYMGLNDLGIERGTPNIFTALIDGTADAVASEAVAAGRSFGVAGLTLPERGSPVPCVLLVGEMARLGCSHAFLRRSFLRDVPVDEFPIGVAAIRQAFAQACERGPSQVEADRRALVEAVEGWQSEGAIGA